MGDSDNQHLSRGSASAAGSGTFLLASGAAAGRGRYVLERELGQGGMGVVWLALDTELDERVALKFVPPEIRRDADALDELRRETQKSRRLTHPNILRIHDFFRCEGEPPFICMEYVEGTTLSAFKAQQPNRMFAWEWLKPVVAQLCQALDYAHGEGVVHRDLKPANMMLDARGRLKLADFGLAATISDTLNRVSLDRGISGTPAYMSPQQMDGRPPQATDDIYALGATLYELLTSKPPFHSGDVLHQARNFTPDTLEQRLADFGITNAVPADVSALILACLAKEPGQRPQSAAVVGQWIGLNLASSATESTGASVEGTSSPALSAEPEPEPSPEPEYPGEASNETPRWQQPWALVVGGVAVVAVLIACVALVMSAKRKRVSAKAAVGSPAPATQPVTVALSTPSGVRWTNSLGMVFVPVPGTAVRFCIWETRKQDYEAYAATTPNLDEAWKNPLYEGVPVTPGPTHPVVNLNWDEVRSFARWLTDKERREGRLTAGQDYRLPTDLEWSAAVGLPPESGATPLERQSKGQPMYAWGGRWPPPPGAANLKDEVTRAQFKTGRAVEGYRDGFATTAPVGSFASNPHGLHDLTGNVAEWCEDRQRVGTAPRVMRGGAWDSDPGSLPADQRPGALPDKRFHNTGFRLVLADVSVPAPAPVAVPTAVRPPAVLAKPGEYVFTTLAGLAGTYGSTDGKGAAAKFNDPHAMAVDRSDNIYVAETWTCLIRRITPAGEVFTVAGVARNRGSTDGPRSVARFNGPRAVAVDSVGNLYVTDTDNFTVRKITPTGIVSTLAGKAGVAGHEDGKGAAARFRGVMGVAVNKAGIVYVADYIGRTIRQITPDGTVTTLAGNHADNSRLRDGLGADARFAKPVGLTLGSDGNLYVSETESGWIRKVTPEGMVTTIAGTGRPGSTDGAASQAQFHDPFTLLMDPAGNLLVADSGNHTIRKITPDGIVTTLAGQAGQKGIAEGVGSDALFNTVRGLALDSQGQLYVSDMNNRVVRKGVPGR